MKNNTDEKIIPLKSINGYDRKRLGVHLLN